MIGRDTAQAIVLRHLATIPSADVDGWVIVDEGTREFDVAWMFCWTAASINSGRRPGITGNNPIIVHKDDGALYMWNPAMPFEPFIARLRDERTTLYRLDESQ